MEQRLHPRPPVEKYICPINGTILPQWVGATASQPLRPECICLIQFRNLYETIAEFAIAKADDAALLCFWNYLRSDKRPKLQVRPFSRLAPSEASGLCGICEHEEITGALQSGP